MNALFPKGNLDSWNISISKYLPEAINTVLRTVDPVVSAALLELTGSSEDFDRDVGSISLVYDDNALPIQLNAELTYSIPAFQLTEASEEAVAHDKAFILAYLQQIEEAAKTTKLEMDVKTGRIVVGVAIKVGYKI